MTQMFLLFFQASDNELVHSETKQKTSPLSFCSRVRSTQSSTGGKYWTS